MLRWDREGRRYVGQTADGKVVVVPVEDMRAAEDQSFSAIGSHHYPRRLYTVAAWARTHATTEDATSEL